MQTIYSARRMRNNEFTSTEQMLKRDSNGALCSFALISDRGHVQLGLSWQQACDMAENLNAEQLECA